MMPLAAPGFPKELELHRLQALYQLLASLTRAKSLEDVYESALTCLESSTAADRAAVLTFDQEGVMRFRAWRGLSDEYRAAVTGHTPWRQDSRNAEPVLVADVNAAEDVARYRDLFAREQIGSLAFVPLELEEGVFGKFMLYQRERHEWTSEEVSMTQVIAAHVALVLQRKRAELARETSEREQVRLAAVVENSYDAIITKDLNGTITSWNQAAEEMFGYTAEEAIGRPVSFLASEERAGEMQMILGRIGRGERVHHFETIRTTKDGRRIDVSITVSPIRDREGRIVGASKILRDITDHKRTEEERRLLLRREQDARATAELLNLVGPILLTEHDGERLVQRITDIATALVGAEYGAFFHNQVGQKGQAPGFYALSGVSRAAFAGFGMPRGTGLLGVTFRSEGIVRSGDITQDPRYGHNPPHSGIPAGHPPVKSYLAAPVVSRSGEILGGLFFGHSAPAQFAEYHEALLKGISAQAAIALDNARLLEQAEWAQGELKRSNEELRRTNEDLEVFAYSASHDLQEPLRTISLSSELLRREMSGRLSEQGSEFLEGILHGTRTMNQLIADLLAYTTATRSAEGPPPAIDSAAVLRDVIQNLKSAIEDAGATVSAADLPAVAMHPMRLAQLFQNLIGNALKYRGREAPRVHVSAGAQDGWTVFSVEDNGIGIEPEYARQIFGLFKRLHSRQEYPGSGLGLAICQRLIEHYGGRIWLDRSAPGGGSTFCFAVPTRQP